MKKYLFALAALAVAFSATPVQAQGFTPYADMPAGVYTLDKHHASLIWKVSHAGLSYYAGRFKSFDATINFDPSDVTKSTVAATIYPASLETDYVPTPEEDFNKKISTSAEWLNADKFPEMTFTSTKVERTGEFTAKVHGNLTFLGVTKPVVLDATYNGAYIEQPFSKKPTIGFSATGSLNRSDWGLKTYIPAIGDKVDLYIEGEFVKND